MYSWVFGNFFFISVLLFIYFLFVFVSPTKTLFRKTRLIIVLILMCIFFCWKTFGIFFTIHSVIEIKPTKRFMHICNFLLYCTTTIYHKNLGQPHVMTCKYFLYLNRMSYVHITYINIYMHLDEMVTQKKKESNFLSSNDECAPRTLTRCENGI